MKNSKFLLFLFSACIGVDELDAPEVDPILVINSLGEALQVGNQVQLEAMYLNEYGVEEQVTFEWTSSDSSITSVSEMGLVMGLATGQATIQAHYDTIESAPVQVVVVSGDADVAEVIVTGPSSQIEVDGILQLSAEARNINGEILPDKVFEWMSDDASIASVDENGEVTGQAMGSVEIVALSEGVQSAPYVVMVGIESRTGMFQSANGYDATGTATLSVNAENDLILQFSSDFATDFALGTFVYLANSTTGSTVRAQGLEIAEITTNGAKEFNVTEVDGNAELDTYQYVIILCKPASLTFGFAELN